MVITLALASWMPWARIRYEGNQEIKNANPNARQKAWVLSITNAGLR